MVFMYIVTANENKNLNTRRYNQLPFTAILLIDGFSFKCCLIDNWECIKKAGTIFRHRPFKRRRRDSLRGAYGVKPLKNLLRSFGCSNPCQIVNLAYRKRPAPFTGIDLSSGGGGIRTPGGYHPTTVFKTVTISHSDTPPVLFGRRLFGLPHRLERHFIPLLDDFVNRQG